MSADFNIDHLAALLRLNRDGGDKIVSPSQLYSVLGHHSYNSVMNDLVVNGLAQQRPATSGKNYVYGITACGQELVREILTRTQEAIAA